MPDLNNTKTRDTSIWDDARVNSATVTSGRLDVNSIEGALSSHATTFSAVARDVAIGNNKSMLSLLNATGSGVTIRIHEIWITNVRTTATTGLVAIFDLFRFTAHSVGTGITPAGMVSTNALNGLVTARTGATITGETTFKYKRWLWSSDEWSSGATDVASFDHALQTIYPVYRHDKSSMLQPLTLLAGEGFHIKQTVNSTYGTFDLCINFTQV